MEVFRKLPSVNWSYRSYTVNELVRIGSFPRLVRISNCTQGQRFYETFTNGQVLYLHGVKEQFRFLAEDESGNEISIPLNSKIKIQNVEQNTKTKEVLTKDISLPVKARCTVNQEIPGLCLIDGQEIVILIRQKGLMRYLSGVSVNKDGVGDHIQCIPVDYDKITFKVLINKEENISYNMIEKFQKQVHNAIMEEIPENEFNSFKGNPEILVNVELVLVNTDEDYTIICSKDEDPKKDYENVQAILDEPPPLPGKKHSITDDSSVTNSDSSSNSRTTEKNKPPISVKPKLKPKPINLSRKQSAKPEVKPKPKRQSTEIKVNENENDQQLLNALNLKQHRITEEKIKEPKKLENSQEDKSNYLDNLKSISDQTQKEKNQVSAIDYAKVTKRKDEVQKNKSQLYHPEGKSFDLKESGNTYDSSPIGSYNESHLNNNDPIKNRKENVYHSSSSESNPPYDIPPSNNFSDSDNSDYEPMSKGFTRPVFEGENPSSTTAMPQTDVESMNPNKDLLFSRPKLPTPPKSEDESSDENCPQVPPRNPEVADNKRTFSPYFNKSEPGTEKNRTPSFGDKIKQNVKARLKSKRKKEKVNYRRIRGTNDVPDDLSKLTCQQLQECLILLKEETLISIFEKNGINGELLLMLNDSIMKNDLGLTDFQILKLNMFKEKKWTP